MPRSARDIGIIFFFTDWYTVEHMKAKLPTSKIQRDFYAFSCNSINSPPPARRNELIWNIGIIIFFFHQLLANVRQKIPKDILEFRKLRNICTPSHGI